MPPAAWDILRLTAALGPLRVDQLAALNGTGSADILHCVDQLIHAHLVVEGADRQIRHSSGLIRAAVAEQVSGVYREHLRRELANAGEPLGAVWSPELPGGASTAV
jgi:hypothetical protein